ncbi:MAG: pyridoxal phosphate-dependent aminotransferase [Alphaproteobacteria bacterium]|nr:pyridoxal phosphate-dependent aminotransferase [Alphaproteobacteria bacterium]
MDAISQGVQRMAPSATVAITQLARERAAAGHDIISLSVGEPDFDTPEHVRDAGIAAINGGKTRYTAADGIAELKQAVADKFNRDNALAVTADQCCVGSGGKQIIFNAMVATLDPGDEVIMGAPYWVSYPDIVGFCGAKPVVVPCDANSGFRLTADQLRAAITPNTRWVILNSPANPSGAIYGEAELAALGEVLLANPHVMVLSDDIYEYLIYDGARFATMASVVPALKARTLTVNGVSKAFAMTGWRIGYATGPKWLLAAMNKLSGQSITNACSISQWASVAALNGDMSFLDDWRAEFVARRNHVVERLRAIPELGCDRPKGAFYVFASCAGAMGRTSAGGTKIESDRDFVMALIAEANVATVHGAAFGMSPYFRISYATSMDRLDVAMDRIEKFCSQLI